jgi:hypothetical protein
MSTEPQPLADAAPEQRARFGYRAPTDDKLDRAFLAWRSETEAIQA